MQRRSRPAQTGLGIDRLQAHESQQPTHSLMIDSLPLMPEPSDHPENPTEGSPGIALIQPPQEQQIL